MNPTSTEHSTRRSSSQLTSESSLRPRNKRLVSGLDEEDDSAVRSLEGSRNASPFSPRSISPIPSPGPSRTGSSLAAQRAGHANNTSAAPGQSPASFAQDPLLSLSGSWSTLQGFASSLLGSSAGGVESPRRRRPLDSSYNRKATSSVSPEWGPRGEDKVGEGYEDRASLVRAMKRRDLLQASGHLGMDATGRFKRRNSDERISSSAPPTEHDDREALAYIHRVRPEDTLAGITIRYNCDAAMVRKANRMWPNDTVQSRRHLVIPVDACGVKGKPVPPPEASQPQPQQQPSTQSNVEDDLLLPTPKNEYPTIHSTSLPTNGWHGPASVSSSNLTQSATQANNAEPPWRHEAWVLFPNSDTPVEIARLHRRDLGFFPPARRKSLTYSDTTRESIGGSTGGGPSHTHTPSASFDLQRSETATSTTSSGSRVTSQQRHNRTPSISQSFKLDGPGGVGTFNRNVRKPGPAQDGLNKLFSQHLPSLAPPPGKDYFGTWNPANLEGTGEGGPGERISGSATPVVGVGGVGGSTSGTGFDLEQVGGAIEGWMRKVATKASSLVPPAGGIPSVNSPGLRATRSPGARGSGVGGGASGNMAMGMGGDINDLIELTDSFEIGEDEDEEAGRGRAASGSGRAGGPAHLRRREGRSGTPVKSTKGE